MTNGDQHDRNRFLDLAMIVVFDIAGPLVAYSLLRSAGQSAVTALVLSGAFPALGVIASLIRHRRADTIGVLVLAGIAVGTILGLLSGDPRLVLVCLGSLRARRPLIYRFAIEFIGAGTPKGREFESLWQYPGFRHAFRLYTVVWGVAYLAEAAARVIIVETTSTGTALTVSKVMPYVVSAAVAAAMRGNPGSGLSVAAARRYPPRPPPNPPRRLPPVTYRLRLLPNPLHARLPR